MTALVEALRVRAVNTSTLASPYPSVRRNSMNIARSALSDSAVYLTHLILEILITGRYSRKIGALRLDRAVSAHMNVTRVN